MSIMSRLELKWMIDGTGERPASQFEGCLLFGQLQ